MLKLYGYWRSSAAYRVRIGLNLKNVAYEQESINLAPSVMAHRSEAYKALNPQMRVPALETPDGIVSQSMAILEWIEETYDSGAPLLPSAAIERARCRAFADVIACDVHPLNNPSVLNVLREEFCGESDQINAWYADWIQRGFAALEVLAEERSGDFLFGSGPTLAEICLIPQIYNARRFKVDLSEFPNLLQIDRICLELDGFQAATPENQPDAVIK